MLIRRSLYWDGALVPLLRTEINWDQDVDKLSHACFFFCITLQRAVISHIPIPKSAPKDQYTALNYRSISLLSYVCMIYSCFINGRLSGFCENYAHLTDEQNGFHPGWDGKCKAMYVHYRLWFETANVITCRLLLFYRYRKKHLTG